MKAIWEPTPQAIANSKMMRFAKLASERTHRDLTTWKALYQWSIEDLGTFWQLCSEFVDVRWIQKPQIAYKPPPPTKMRGASWFPDGSLNFCQNILPPPDGRTVILSLGEKLEPQIITGKQLHNEVAKLAKFLRTQGVKPKDVVCGVLCNSYHAIAAMLATTSLGAVWSSCSPDFGAAAITDRLGQIQPKVAFFSLNYFYNDRLVDCRQTVEDLLSRLPSLKASIGIEHVPGSLANRPQHVVSYETVVGSPLSNQLGPIEALPFEETRFDHPVYILFSSGTTGIPKCIVHGAGGTLLQHKKEQILHTDLSAEDRLFYFTTCGWMMWNWMVTGLACGASLVCFEGSPRHPSPLGLWHVVDDFKVSVFGTSPKFVALSKSEGWTPNATYSFTTLRSVLATGSPLLPEHFTWLRENVKDLPVASISGGTDIVSCFMLGNPLLPVYAGAIQSAGLGMAIQATDEQGRSVIDTKGELVCTKPFVSMPLYFLNDADGERYRQSYFAYYPGAEVWRHGDFVSIDEHGAIVVYGRSDATLNPGGVRIGTAELYRCVENLAEVEDSVAIGFEFTPGDPSILLFVKLKKDLKWNEGIEVHIKGAIRKNLSPRHVPYKIFPVLDIPYTRNGKKIELAVSQAVQSLPIPNLGAIANPDCLKEYVEIGKTLK